MKIKLLLIIVFVNLMLCACGRNESEEPQKDIIGKWESSDNSLILEFTSQGKVNSVTKHDSFTNESTSNLIFIDDTHILGVWEFNLSTWNIKIYGDKMTLTRDDGEKLKMSKIE